MYRAQKEAVAAYSRLPHADSQIGLRRNAAIREPSTDVGSTSHGNRAERLPVRELTLLPIQPIDDAALRQVLEDLRARGVNVRLEPDVLRPRGSYDARRRQLRAEVLLESLARRPERPLLGLTDADCYAGRLNFVFGMGAVGDGAAVVSLYRLRVAASDCIFRQRALTEIFHELGHAIGLGHCRNPRCVMRFSNSLAETDFKGEELCAACVQRMHSLRIKPHEFI